jgi:hypothetical protein
MRNVQRLILVLWGAVSLFQLSACNKGAAPEQSGLKLELVSLHPSTTAAGKVFNPQSNGFSGLAVKCRNATKDTEIVFDGQALSTVYGGPELLTTTVPTEMIMRARAVSVILRDGNVESNALTFSILP